MAIKVLGVHGGIGSGGPAGHALRYFLGALESRGAQCQAFDIGTLPLMDGRDADAYPPAVTAWLSACEATDGFVFAVPSYHGGMLGGLKNALDFIGMPQAGGKPFAVVGIAMGDAEPGVTDVTKVMRHIGAVAGVPDIVISRAKDHWGAGEEPQNASIAVTMHKVAEDLLALCALRADGKMPGL